MKTINWLFLFIIIVLSVFLRWWGIIHGSFAFTYDIGRDLLAVRDLIYQHKISLIGPTSGQMGIFYGPWWYWLLLLPFGLFNGNTTWIVSFMALSGVTSVILAFWWGRKFWDETFGFTLAGIIAVSPFFVSNTTQIWSPDFLILGTLIAIMLFYRLEKLSNIKLVLFGLTIFLLAEMEIFFGAFFIVFLLLISLVWKMGIILSKKILFIAAGGLIIELPRLLFELRHNFLQTNNLLIMLKENKGYSFHIDERFLLVKDNLTSVIPNINAIVFVASILTVLAVLAIGLHKIFRRDQKIFILELLSITFLFFILTISYQKDFWHYYLFGVPVILAVLVATALSTMMKFLPKKIVITIIIFYLVLLANPKEILAVLRNPNFSGNASVFRNQIAVLDYIYKQTEGKDFNYIAYTPPQIEYTWRYLFWWYGRNKYHYEPKEKRSERLFVIIEPDPGYEGRIVNWLKIREGDGITIKEETLPSGIMIQSRIRPKE